MQPSEHPSKRSRPHSASPASSLSGGSPDALHHSLPAGSRRLSTTTSSNSSSSSKHAPASATTPGRESVHRLPPASGYDPGSPAFQAHHVPHSHHQQQQQQHHDSQPLHRTPPPPSSRISDAEASMSSPFNDRMHQVPPSAEQEYVPSSSSSGSASVLIHHPNFYTDEHSTTNPNNIHPAGSSSINTSGRSSPHLRNPSFRFPHNVPPAKQHPQPSHYHPHHTSPVARALPPPPPPPSGPPPPSQRNPRFWRQKFT
ncbi:hypothetical protein DFS34DRAFT_663138 [Phlyctochytrium arcticum]|nr:hypothetical protein DFS34DRAFT_663138 [Phlyctochytrium arcticum]